MRDGMPLETGEKVEVVSFSPDVHKKIGMYLQFIDDKGYEVHIITPDEADKMADMLKAVAAKARELFPEKK